MNQYCNGKLAKWFESFVMYLKEKKQHLYRNNKSSVTINTLRFVFGILLLIVALYAGIYIVLYGLVLALLIIGGYFLLPPDYMKKDFPVVEEKIKKEVVELSAKAKEEAIVAAHKVKEGVSKMSDEIKNEYEELKSKVKSKSSNAAQEVKKDVSKAKNEVKKDVSNASTKTKKKIKRVKNKVKKVENDINK